MISGSSHLSLWRCPSLEPPGHPNRKSLPKRQIHYIEGVNRIFCTLAPLVKFLLPLLSVLEHRLIVRGLPWDLKFVGHLLSCRTDILRSFTLGVHVNLLSYRGDDLTTLPRGCFPIPAIGCPGVHKNRFFLRLIPELEKGVGGWHPGTSAHPRLVVHPLLHFLCLRTWGALGFSFPLLFSLNGRNGGINW